KVREPDDSILRHFPWDYLKRGLPRPGGLRSINRSPCLRTNDPGGAVPRQSAGHDGVLPALKGRWEKARRLCRASASATEHSAACGLSCARAEGESTVPALPDPQKIGNPHLRRAFSEAACLFLRRSERAKELAHTGTLPLAPEPPESFGR